MRSHIYTPARTIRNPHARIRTPVNHRTHLHCNLRPSHPAHIPHTPCRCQSLPQSTSNGICRTAWRFVAEGTTLICFSSDQHYHSRLHIWLTPRFVQLTLVVANTCTPGRFSKRDPQTQVARSRSSQSQKRFFVLVHYSCVGGKSISVSGEEHIRKKKGGGGLLQ